MAVSVENGLITLKQAREFRGLSQGELSRLADVDRSTITRIEAGTRHCAVSYDTAYALCHALGMRITDIYWPFGLTALGRPMGAKNKTENSTDDNAGNSQCSSCFTVLPLNGHCDFCN